MNEIKYFVKLAKELNEKEISEYQTAYLKGIYEKLKWIVGYLIAMLVIGILSAFIVIGSLLG